MLQLFGNAIGQVVLVSILVGAGLPALFALGIRSMALSSGGPAEVDAGTPARPVMKVVGWLCFAVVLAVVALGLTVIVSSGFGYHISFQNIFPTLVKK